MQQRVTTASAHRPSTRGSPFFEAGSRRAAGRARPPFFQPKLTIGAPGDRFEREADRVADQVVSASMAPPVQRMCFERREETKRELHRASLGVEKEAGLRSPRGAQVPGIQREVQVRPPGPGEASAFHRRQELVDRLNRQSQAIQYRLDGRVLRYNVVDEGRLTNFDREMRSFIDRVEVVPMLLISSAGFVGGGPLFVDSLESAYVDLDDLLGSADLSFQLNLIHVLTERFGVRDYERRIHTNMPEFDLVHRAGLEAEAAHLRDVIGDPTIGFNYEETRPNGTDVFAFRSAEGFRVFHVFRGGAGRAERSGTIFVLTRDQRRLTIAELMAERAAAAPAPVPP